MSDPSPAGAGRRALALSVAPLEPFVPRPLLAADASAVGRIQAATIFADISGYTRLAERLLVRGRAGTELLLSTIDATFTGLIDVIHANGGDVLRFGGDALFIAFTGEGHHERARVCASGLLSVVAARPAVEVPGGRVRLRQSIGLASGELNVVRWVGQWTEEVVFGPVVTETLTLEHAARPGQVLTRAGVLRRRSTGQPPPAPRPGTGPVEAAIWMPPRLARLAAGGMDPAHRSAAVAFVGVRGLDSTTRPAEVVVTVMDGLARVTDRLGVMPLCTDVAPDGVTLLLTSGGVESAGDDAERLLAAVRELVHRSASVGIDIRAGVHAGLVFSAVIGHPQRQMVAALGDATNVAARLMQSSSPGEVIVSGDFVDRLHRRPALRWRPPMELRGRRARVVVAEALGGEGHPQTQRVVSVIGRRAEQDRILTALSTDRVVEVIGPTGSGVTSLVEEVLARITRPVVRIPSGVDDLGVPFAVSTRLAALLDVGIPEVEDVAAEFALGVRVAQVATAVRPRLTDVVIAIDSADHLDVGSRRVMERLVADDVTLLLAARAQTELTLPDSVPRVVILLEPLPDEAIRDIAAAAARRPLSTAELERIVESARGNPGVAVRLAADAEGRRLPADLAAIAAVDLDRIEPYLRPLARAAAVCGATIDHRVCAAVAEMPEEAVGQALAALVPLVEAASPGRSRFTDELVRAALIESMPVSQLRTLSLRLARHLVAVGIEPFDVATLLRIAHGFADAHQPELTLRWGERAANAALNAGAPHAAAQMWSRVWPVAQRNHVVNLAAVASGWAAAAAAAGSEAEVDGALRLATRQTSDPVVRADLVVRRARAASRAGRARAAATLLGQALAALDRVPAGEASDRARLRVWLERARVSLDTGDPRGASDALRRVGGLLGAAEPIDAARTAALEVDVAIATAAPDAEAIAARALHLARSVDDPMLIGAIACNVGLLLDNRGEWAGALDHYAVAERAFVRAGSMWSVALTRLNRSTILLELGDADAASVDARESARELASAGVAAAELAAVTHVVRVELRRGVADGSAIATLRDGIARLIELGEDELAAFRTAAELEMLLLCGQPRQAAALANAELATAGRFGEAHLLPVTLRRLLAMAQRAIGSGTAMQTAREALDLARRRESAAEVCLCLQAVRLVEWDRGRSLPPSEAAELSALEQRLGVVAYPWFRLGTATR